MFATLEPGGHAGAENRMTESRREPDQQRPQPGPLEQELRPAARLVSVWIVALILGILVLGLLLIVLSPDTFSERLFTVMVGMAWTVWLVLVVGGQAERRDDTPPPPPPARPDVVDTRTLQLERQTVTLTRQVEEQGKLLGAVVEALEDVLGAVEASTDAAEEVARARRLTMPPTPPPTLGAPLVHWPTERALHDWPEVVSRDHPRHN